MNSLIPKKFQDKMRVLPVSTQYARSPKSIKYGELLSAVDMMDKEKCIVFTKAEYEQEYGKNGVAGLRLIAKKNKVPFRLRVVEDGKEVVIFKNDLLPTVHK